MLIEKKFWILLLIIFSSFTLTYFELTENAIAASENSLIILFKSKKHSDLVKTLSLKEESTLSAENHYLLLKSYNRLKNFPQSKRQLIYLERKLSPFFRDLILYEKVMMYKKSGEKDAILKAIKEHQGSPISPFLLKSISELLIKEFSGFHNQSLLQQSMDSLIPYADNFEKGAELLRLYITTLAPDDPRAGRFLLDLWKLDNVESLSPNEKRIEKSIKAKADEFENEIVTHFQKQKQYKNYTYIIKTAPKYLSLIEDKNSELFTRLRRLYLHSMKKKRKFSVLINKLSQPTTRNTLGLTEYEAFSIQFDLMVRKGDTKSAIATINKMIKMEPARDLDMKYLALAKYYFYRNYFKQALYFFDRLQLHKAKSYNAAEAQWYIWRTHFLMGNRAELQTIAQWANDFDFNDKEIGARFCYWGHKLNLYPNSNIYRCYRQYPLTYYGLHSKFSANHSIIESPGSIPVSQTFAATGQITEEQKNELGFLKLVYQLNEEELADSIVRSVLRSADSSLMLALANMLLEVKRYYMVQIIVESKFRSVLEKQISGRKLLLPYFYPLAYDEEVSRLEDKKNVPKTLIMSVMREESHFNPQIKSVAGAVGLMQLMPRTAKYIGKTIGFKVEPGSLVNPKVNLKLGSAYLKRLMKRYKGNLFYTLAAYNGGPTNVKRWIKKTKTKDNDDFVESITFAETQNYVRRVMRTFYFYRNMYESL